MRALLFSLLFFALVAGCATIPETSNYSTGRVVGQAGESNQSGILIQEDGTKEAMNATAAGAAFAQPPPLAPPISPPSRPRGRSTRPARPGATT